MAQNTLQKSIVCAAFLLLWAVPLRAQTVEVIKLPQLEALLSEKSEGLLVINFWATWCKPCVAELPHFEEAREKYAKKNVRFVLISLDFADNLPRVEAFAQKKALGAELLLLDELDANKWVDTVDPNWQGDIPATLFLHTNKRVRVLHAKEFSSEALEQLIESYL